MAARQTSEPVQSLLFLGYGFESINRNVHIVHISTSTKTGVSNNAITSTVAAKVKSAVITSSPG
jgi:hypothetical protein